MECGGTWKLDLVLVVGDLSNCQQEYGFSASCENEEAMGLSYTR